MSRIEALRAYAEGSTVDERLADEVLRGYGLEKMDLRNLVVRAVRTAMLIELMDLRAFVAEQAERHDAGDDWDGAEALYSVLSVFSGREDTYRAWVAEAEEGA